MFPLAKSRFLDDKKSDDIFTIEHSLGFLYWIVISPDVAPIKDAGITSVFSPFGTTLNNSLQVFQLSSCKYCCCIASLLIDINLTLLFAINPKSDNGLESISITWSIVVKSNAFTFTFSKALLPICLTFLGNPIVISGFLWQSLKAHLPMFSSELGNIIVSKSKDSQSAKA